MDISETELMQIFEDVDDETTSEEPCFSRHVRDVTDVAPKVELEICYGDDKIQEIDAILDSALLELNINNSELRTTIRNDLYLVHGSKSTMMQKYGELLRKTYHVQKSDPPEIVVKQVIIAVLPKVIALRIQSKSKEPRASQDLQISDDDKKILQFIAGALLKWGLSKFSGDDADWIRSQISQTDTLSSEFEITNRGFLVVPTASFLSLILKAESELRLSMGPKSVCEQLIINKLVSTNPTCLNPALQLLIRRFIRARAHMHCKQLLESHKNESTIAEKITQHSVRLS